MVPPRVEIGGRCSNETTDGQTVTTDLMPSLGNHVSKSINVDDSENEARLKQGKRELIPGQRSDLTCDRRNSSFQRGKVLPICACASIDSGVGGSGIG
jgi:hypothetical protein